MTTAFLELAEQKTHKPIAKKEQKHIIDGLLQIIGDHRQPNEVYAYCLEINKQLETLVRQTSEDEISAVNTARFRGELAKEGYKAYSPAFTAEQYAKRAGISRQAVLKRLKAGTLLGWRENRQNAYRIPSWQFNADGRLLPGMAETLKVLNIPELDEWAKILFFLQQRKSLAGKRPIELIEMGEIETTINLARDYVG